MPNVYLEKIAEFSFREEDIVPMETLERVEHKGSPIAGAIAGVPSAVAGFMAGRKAGFAPAATAGLAVLAGGVGGVWGSEVAKKFKSPVAVSRVGAEHVDRSVFDVRSPNYFQNWDEETLDRYLDARESKILDYVRTNGINPSATSRDLDPNGLGYFHRESVPDRNARLGLLEKEAKTLTEIEEDRLHRNRRANSAPYYAAAAGAAGGAGSYLAKPTGKQIPTGKLQAGKGLKMRKERIMDYVKRSPNVRKSHLVAAGKKGLVGAGVGLAAGAALKEVIKHNSNDKARNESKVRRSELRDIRKERNHKKV